MFTYIVKRLLQLIPVLLIVDIVTFGLVRLSPGGPFTEERAIPPQIKAQLDAYYGYDKPLIEQYFTHLKNILVKGDFGPSMKQVGYSVNELIAQSLPISLELGLYGLLIALLIGIPVGVIASAKKNSLLDYIPMSLAMLGICLPTFVIGPLMLLFFSIKLGWLNPLGWENPSDRILPSLTLGLFYAAYIARLTRAGMLEILSQDYIRTALAKGVSSKNILIKHALKGGILPVVNFLGPAFAGLLSGSFIVETIFFIPGLGRYFVNGAFNRDYSLVQATVLLYATLLVVLNLLTDIIQAKLNPKIKLGE